VTPAPHCALRTPGVPRGRSYPCPPTGTPRSSGLNPLGTEFSFTATEQLHDLKAQPGGARASCWVRRQSSKGTRAGHRARGHAEPALRPALGGQQAAGGPQPVAHPRADPCPRPAAPQGSLTSLSWSRATPAPSARCEGRKKGVSPGAADGSRSLPKPSPSLARCKPPRLTVPKLAVGAGFSLSWATQRPAARAELRRGPGQQRGRAARGTPTHAPPSQRQGPRLPSWNTSGCPRWRRAGSATQRFACTQPSPPGSTSRPPPKCQSYWKSLLAH